MKVCTNCGTAIPKPEADMLVYHANHPLTCGPCYRTVMAQLWQSLVAEEEAEEQYQIAIQEEYLADVAEEAAMAEAEERAHQDYLAEKAAEEAYQLLEEEAYQDYLAEKAAEEEDDGPVCPNCLCPLDFDGRCEFCGHDEEEEDA